MQTNEIQQFEENRSQNYDKADLFEKLLRKKCKIHLFAFFI